MKTAPPHSCIVGDNPFPKHHHVHNELQASHFANDCYDVRLPCVENVRQAYSKAGYLLGFSKRRTKALQPLLKQRYQMNFTERSVPQALTRLLSSNKVAVQFAFRFYKPSMVARTQRDTIMLEPKFLSGWQVGTIGTNTGNFFPH